MPSKPPAARNAPRTDKKILPKNREDFFIVCAQGRGFYFSS